MLQIIKRVLKCSPFYYPLRNWRQKRVQIKQLLQWENNGRPVPPPHLVKQQALVHYATKYGLRVLVETGTCYGDMVEAMKNNFDHIYSIELSKELFDEATQRFKATPNIELIHGDSGKLLATVMNKLNQPALFWLDGHYSAGVTAKGEKDTPIYEELDHILSGKGSGHVIIIDDARCFGTDPGYPSIEEITEFIKRRKETVEICVQDDSIRITPI